MKTPEKYQHIVSTAMSIALPGLGHFSLGYWVEGFVLSLIYSIALEGFLIGVFVVPGKFAAALPVTFLVMLVVIWGVAQGLFILRVRNEEEGDLERRQKLFREYVVASLRGDLETARHKLDKVLEMNRGDVDALFHLYQLLRSTGDEAGAKKILKKCRDLDEEGKWKWELQESAPATRAESAS